MITLYRTLMVHDNKASNESPIDDWRLVCASLHVSCTEQCRYVCCIFVPSYACLHLCGNLHDGEQASKQGGENKLSKFDFTSSHVKLL